MSENAAKGGDIARAGIRVLALVFCLALLALGAAAVQARPMVIDHRTTDIFQIPDYYLNQAKTDIAWHYAHTSHGEQITSGMWSLMEEYPKFSLEEGWCELPESGDYLRIFNGQKSGDYVTPEDYWQTAWGLSQTQEVLSQNREINVSAWAWCTQADWYSSGEVQQYLDAMADLEKANPDVTFVYMTGNAQARGEEGFNRWQRNQQIRNWVTSDPEANRVLFDFADLDAWYNGGGNWQKATFTYRGQEIPVEANAFRGDETGHTTYLSALQKAKAAWWMLARIVGWEGAEGIDREVNP